MENKTEAVTVSVNAYIRMTVWQQRHSAGKNRRQSNKTIIVRRWLTSTCKFRDTQNCEDMFAKIKYTYRNITLHCRLICSEVKHCSPSRTIATSHTTTIKRELWKFDILSLSEQSEGNETCVDRMKIHNLWERIRKAGKRLRCLGKLSGKSLTCI